MRKKGNTWKCKTENEARAYMQGLQGGDLAEIILIARAGLPASEISREHLDRIKPLCDMAGGIPANIAQIARELIREQFASSATQARS